MERSLTYHRLPSHLLDQVRYRVGSHRRTTLTSTNTLKMMTSCIRDDYNSLPSDSDDEDSTGSVKSMELRQKRRYRLSSRSTTSRASKMLKPSRSFKPLTMQPTFSGQPMDQPRRLDRSLLANPGYQSTPSPASSVVGYEL
jgi:hypothetical protein